MRMKAENVSVGKKCIWKIVLAPSDSVGALINCKLRWIKMLTKKSFLLGVNLKMRSKLLS